MATLPALVPDGVTDNTAALQARLDALGPGEPLVIPPGTYRADGPLIVRDPEDT